MQFRDIMERTCVRQVGFAALVTLSALPVSAEDIVAVPDAMPTGDIGHVALSLFVIVAAILAVGWLFRRVQVMRGSQSQVMQILATQLLGPKERVMLVRIADRHLVLGITATQMQTLLVLDESGDNLPVTEELSPNSFAARLRSAFNRGAQ